MLNKIIKFFKKTWYWIVAIFGGIASIIIASRYFGKHDMADEIKDHQKKIDKAIKENEKIIKDNRKWLNNN